MTRAPATDTIVAIATPPGRGAVGILRLSGPRAVAIAERLAGALPPPRQFAWRHFRTADGEAIDSGLVLRFAAPASFTGEDVVELQGHGGPVLLQALVEAACAAGARPARPGEFSERAFLNGRLDLAQAEAIADLIDAGTRDAARAAQRSLDGALSQRVTAVADELTALRVWVEGALDFSDEDIDWLGDARLRERIAALREHLQVLLADAGRGRRLRDGLTVALTGRPNVGKSTLLNRLAGAEVAIVTEIPGTTRDVLRENLDLHGLPVTLVDTAGLRDTDDPVEREGVRRARAALERAELALFLVDARSGITAEDARLLAGLPSALPTLVIHNKCDLLPAPPPVTDDGRTHLFLSAATGAGVDALIDALRRFAGLGEDSQSAFSARTRHLDALRRTLACVADAQTRLAEGAGAELAAEELRLAQDALGEITGRVSSDALLGEIFSRFCIGK
ncbi:tRNA uridine-5-carboxymethylaminomethyl(34) synthesis GTPase MnmE [Fontimonas sp. SYSU GA230001]|uniref:tRNA uridine-5-carboxymethylaminomethyl(34) synthesis GTPase MnmE n=1 Tax=Fontimonas sp. SYSU GA230001 TaxID=3142450 RepID=UPI0032B5A247